jgi:predicted ATP-dependent serine protease
MGVTSVGHIPLVNTDEGELIVLKDIVVPKKFYRRIQFELPVLDELFGGTEMPGILPGSTFLFTGSPGAGKSTMCLQLADMLDQKAQVEVLYNVGEESKYMVKMRADRLGLQQQFTISHIAEIDELLQSAEDREVEVLFIDSLQSLRDGELERSALLRNIGKKVQVWAHGRDVAVFLIGHITKGGGFAGPMELKHDLDAHIHLSLDKDTGNRVFMLDKNRFGPAMMPYEFVLSSNGLDFRALAQESSKSDASSDGGGGGPSRSSSRRDEVLKFIMDKLKEGERISGYCFERLNVECSGGWWRGMVARAVKKLKDGGYTMAVSRSGGRAYDYMESAP